MAKPGGLQALRQGIRRELTESQTSAEPAMGTRWPGNSCTTMTGAGPRSRQPVAIGLVIEKPQYGLAWSRIRCRLLQLKAYTKGEHVLRFEATVHNTKELRCRRSLENFPEIIARLAGMAERFCTALDCVDISFLNDTGQVPARFLGTRTRSAFGRCSHFAAGSRCQADRLAWRAGQMKRRAGQMK